MKIIKTTNTFFVLNKIPSFFSLVFSYFYVENFEIRVKFSNTVSKTQILQANYIGFWRKEKCLKRRKVFDMPTLITIWECIKSNTNILNYDTKCCFNLKMNTCIENGFFLENSQFSPINILIFFLGFGYFSMGMNSILY